MSVSALQSNFERSELAQTRGIAALIAREQAQLLIKELADFLVKNPTALCRSAPAVEELSLSNEKLEQAIDWTRNRVSLHCKNYQVWTKFLAVEASVRVVVA